MRSPSGVQWCSVVHLLELPRCFFFFFLLQHLISERNHLKVFLLKNMVWAWAGRDYDEIKKGLWGWRSWAPPGGPGPGAALLLPGGPVATAHLLAGVH